MIARLLALSLALLSLSCATGEGLGGLDSVLKQGLPGLGPAPLDTQTVVAGLKDALRVGTDRTVSLTSRVNGYLGNKLIRIHTPESLSQMTGALRAVGLGSKVDELEVSMNRAAEKAAGEAAAVFWKGIQQMTVEDAWGILDGGDTAATDYFRRTTSDELRARFSPIVANKMKAVGLVQLYDELTARYRAIPLASSFAGEPPDLRQYVTQKALDGLFTVLGQQEAEIRRDPAARTTELLRRVFGDVSRKRSSG